MDFVYRFLSCFRFSYLVIQHTLPKMSPCHRFSRYYKHTRIIGWILHRCLSIGRCCRCYRYFFFADVCLPIVKAFARGHTAQIFFILFLQFSKWTNELRSFFSMYCVHWRERTKWKQNVSYSFHSHRKYLHRFLRSNENWTFSYAYNIHLTSLWLKS